MPKMYMNIYFYLASIMQAIDENKCVLSVIRTIWYIYVYNPAQEIKNYLLFEHSGQQK